MVVTLAVIGGTGLYHLFDNPEDISDETPYGPTSAPITVGELGGRKIAFLPRHGGGHTLLPSELPYRANLWALHELGVSQVVGVNAVGSLRPEMHRGDFVLCDQFVDRTWGRQDTFSRNGAVAYVGAADPYCGRLRAAAYGALTPHLDGVHRDGTVVVIQGPRFSTRAESRWFAGQGWDVINMTQYPEVILARELGLCYVNLSYVTDYDAGVAAPAGEPADTVSHQEVLGALERGGRRIREALDLIVPALADDPTCGCRTAMAGAQA